MRSRRRLLASMYNHFDTSPSLFVDMRIDSPEYRTLCSGTPAGFCLCIAAVLFHLPALTQKSLARVRGQIQIDLCTMKDYHGVL
ncbi:hypothetical protein CALCODRAFT_125624 [Calocera cornea HHB12733]|uniref:Uncharacterized protein n=1 Tax=Calocera cornea HHB12733 TaxID=1353952 RepID=A0A165CWY0_9BASI|nr:hypothetical protein CALCODRAFT_125624 [Calocera cornea HHB12733]